MIWDSLISSLLDILFPVRCVLCGEYILFSSNPFIPVCMDCDFIPTISEKKRCNKCSMPLISEIGICMRCRSEIFCFDNNFSLFLYSEKIKELIHQYKFNNNKNLSLWFAKSVFIQYKERYRGIPVIPVPFRRSGKRKRGWDHIEIIVNILKTKYNIPVYNILKRKYSKAQKTLDVNNRKLNIAGTISIKNNSAALPSKVVLFDDIFTTGATANECSKVLKNAGVKEVYVLTIAID